MGSQLITAIPTARDDQPVPIPGTSNGNGNGNGPHAAQAREQPENILQQHKQLATEAKEVLDAHPLTGY